MALRRAPFWLLAAALATATLVGAWHGASHRPSPGRETTLWLAVESLALDGDLAPAPEDRARFEARFGSPPDGVLVEGTGEAKRYEAPAPWRGAAALARRALGRRGPFLLQGVLASAALLLVFALLEPRLGGRGAALLLAVAGAGSVTFLLFSRLEPNVVPACAMAAAAWLVWWRRTGPATGPEDVYRGEATARRALARWLGAGAAFGLVASTSVAALPLAWPLLAAPPRGRRWAAGSLFVLGTVVFLAVQLATSGALWPPVESALDRRLFGWAAVGLVLGRDVGVIPYFLPVVLLAATLARDEGRRWTFAAVCAAMGLQVVLAPFDFVEGALPVGNGWFLAPFVLLLATVGHGESRRWTLAPLVVAAPLLAPWWLAASAPEAVATAVAERLEPVRTLLPVATTLRSLAGASDLERPGILARGLAPGIVAGEGGRLSLRWKRGTLMLASDHPLSSVRLELGSSAPTEIDVGGGRLGNTILRPNGDVAFDVSLSRDATRRHALWWARGGAWIYLLDLRLDATPAAPIPLEIAFGRPLVPEATGR